MVSTLKVNTQGEDTTPILRNLLEQCAQSSARKLVVQTGRYNFWPDRATEEYLFIANNDEGLKRIAFNLNGLNDFEIDGQGSTFVFHSFMVPFALRNCRRITLRNVSIDWARPFHSEAIVLAVGQKSVDLLIPPAYPYEIRHRKLVFLGEGKDTYEIGNVLEFDTLKAETAYMAHDHFAAGKDHQAVEVGARTVQLSTRFTSRPMVGNTLVLQDSRRLCPAITIGNSSEIHLADINIHHCGGMGVIAQLSSDLKLDRVNVTPALDSGRILSITADATHFVNCGGQIELTDCLFENQMDDATNVHGIYAQVTGRPSPDSIDVRLMHHQQFGIDIAEAGDLLELVHGQSLMAYHEDVVSSVERLNKEFSRLTFRNTLPEQTRVGDCVNSLRWQANVTIRGCTARNNRARGFLLSTTGKLLIEGNTFHTPGAAILIVGDANRWFESGAVQDVAIRGNKFDACNYGVWGRAAIQIAPEIPEEQDGSLRYHRNIRIEDNEFNVFDKRLVAALGVKGLTIRGNKISHSEAYPAQNQHSESFEQVGCLGVSISGNQFEPKSAAPHPDRVSVGVRPARTGVRPRAIES